MIINVDPKEQIIKSFSKRRTIAGILAYTVMVCIVFAINSFRHPDLTLTGLSSKTELGLSIGTGAALLVILFFFWRCPSCNKFLGFKTNPKSCPHCKAGLEPDWTKTEKPVMAMFKKKKKRMWVLFAICLIFLIPFLVVDENPHSTVATVFAVISVVVEVGTMILMFITWRCPNCNSFLWNEANPSNCPRCNVRLRM